LKFKKIQIDIVKREDIKPELNTQVPEEEKYEKYIPCIHTVLRQTQEQ
jgi:hypothetical protein